MDECVTFLAAGHETTSNLVAWTMVLLAQHPEWQERAREEVREVMGAARGGKAGAMDLDRLGELKLMAMILNESLRLYPPVYSMARTCVQTVKLSDEVTVPAGCDIMVPIGLMHRDAAVWGDDANEFRPERFAHGASAFGGAFLPFALGPRICIGQSFAIAEAKVILAHLLLQFSWRLSASYRHHPKFMITLRAKYGFSFVLTSLL